MDISKTLEDPAGTQEKESITPTVDSEEYYESGMVEAHTARVQDVARALKDGESVAPITVRAFLGWFWHSQRRGVWISSHIRRLLEENDLITEPDFQSTYLDAEIQFRLKHTAPENEDLSAGAIKQEGDSPFQAENGIWSGILEDPTYRISKLAASNRRPTFVSPNASIQEATTIMLANDYSQLPVMTSTRDVKGVISWKSLGVRLALGKSPSQVQDAMEPFAEVASDESLFRVIPIIVENDYAIVRGVDKTILGIITTSDLSLQFRQLSEPFLLLGEIENHIRGIISARFSVSEMRDNKDSGDADRDVNSVSDLTFGEYQRLLEAPANWEKLGVSLDRVVFTKLLEKVRTIRNDVMHFDPDGIDDSDLVALRDFVRFLRALKSLEVT